MSVLLQSIQTSKYVDQKAGWTEQLDRAREFSEGMDALFYCYQHHLRNMRILGQFDDPHKNFTIHLTQDSTE